MRETWHYETELDKQRRARHGLPATQIRKLDAAITRIEADLAKVLRDLVTGTGCIEHNRQRVTRIRELLSRQYLNRQVAYADERASLARREADLSQRAAGLATANARANIFKSAATKALQAG